MADVVPRVDEEAVIRQGSIVMKEGFGLPQRVWLSRNMSALENGLVWHE